MRARGHILLGTVLAVAALSSPASAGGPTPGGAAAQGETSPEAVARAKEHFQKGRELYQAGAYREAIGELEAAHALDPHAKDLVYNLAIVNEKLGQIDSAINYVHRYQEMDLDPPERARADAYLKRLEGAKKEMETSRPGPVVVVPPGPAGDETPPQPEPQQPRGRIDAATLTAAGVAVAGFGVGIVLGVKALADRPTNFVAGKTGTFQELESQQQSAHNEAIVADIGLGVGVAAAAVTAYLYFGRTKKPRDKTTTRVTVSPVASGGQGAVVMLGGSF